MRESMGELEGAQADVVFIETVQALPIAGKGDLVTREYAGRIARERAPQRVRGKWRHARKCTRVPQARQHIRIGPAAA